VSGPPGSIHVRGVFFRAHNPRWAYAPLSGEGARRHGGRFNPKGAPALYLSERLETAWLEAQQGFPFKAQPMTMVAYRVDCAGIADMVVGREALGITMDQLACPWEALAAAGETPPSWQLAAALMTQGFVGLRVPSFAPRATNHDVNLVLWRWGEAPPHRVLVVDDHDRLPHDDRSWRTERE
jgi:RES domain-containing protein